MDEEKRQLKDYSNQGVGRFVVMHVTQLNGYFDAMELCDLLGGAIPVTYSSRTSLIQFYWPRPDQVEGITPPDVNRLINQAINTFMAHCDRIEFYDEELGDAVGVRLRRAAGIPAGLLLSLINPLTNCSPDPDEPEMPPFEFGCN